MCSCHPFFECRRQAARERTVTLSTVPWAGHDNRADALAIVVNGMSSNVSAPFSVVIGRYDSVDDLKDAVASALSHRIKGVDTGYFLLFEVLASLL